MKKNKNNTSNVYVNPHVYFLGMTHKAWVRFVWHAFSGKYASLHDNTHGWALSDRLPSLSSLQPEGKKLSHYLQSCMGRALKKVFMRWWRHMMDPYNFYPTPVVSGQVISP